MAESKLAEMRKADGLRQLQLANAIGVTPGSISMWERGLARPEVTQILPLAATLQVSAEEVLRVFQRKEGE